MNHGEKRDTPQVKVRKKLLVKGQSEISEGQDFDRGRRSFYSEH